MYRGSSHLLQRDYKVHKKAVREIIDTKYNSLWDYVPSENNIEEANELLFNSDKGLYWKIKESYNWFDSVDGESSDTLTTKILMGTFGCVPAFDRFLKSGIKTYQDNHEGRKTKIGKYKLTQSIEKDQKHEATESFKALATFALEHSEELKIKSDFYYPPMECVDMYFWEIGYEMDIVTLLKSKNINKDIKEKLYKKSVELNYCDDGLTYDEAASAIKSLNYEGKL